MRSCSGVRDIIGLEPGGWVPDAHLQSVARAYCDDAGMRACLRLEIGTCGGIASNLTIPIKNRSWESSILRYGLSPEKCTVSSAGPKAPKWESCRAPAQ